MVQALMEPLNGVQHDHSAEDVEVAEATEDYHSQQTHYKDAYICPYSSQ